MKQAINQCTVKFPSKSSNESFARCTAAAFIAQLDPTMDELYDMKTAVSEAVTNATVHGYPDQIGLITMTIRIFAPACVEIIVKDTGCGISDIEQAKQPMFTTGGAERSGMGFTIMESFMDSLSIRSVAGKGTTVKMKKQLALRVGK